MTATRAVRKGREKNVVCTKTIVAKDEHKDAVQDLCATYAATMKDTKKGILSFECTQDNFEENSFHFWERYKNTAYFNESMSSEETSTFLKEVRLGPAGRKKERRTKKYPSFVRLCCLLTN